MITKIGLSRVFDKMKEKQDVNVSQVIQRSIYENTDSSNSLSEFLFKLKCWIKSLCSNNSYQYFIAERQAKRVRSCNIIAQAIINITKSNIIKTPIDNNKKLITRINYDANNMISFFIKKIQDNKIQFLAQENEGGVYLVIQLSLVEFDIFINKINSLRKVIDTKTELNQKIKNNINMLQNYFNDNNISYKDYVCNISQQNLNIIQMINYFKKEKEDIIHKINNSEILSSELERKMTKVKVRLQGIDKYIHYIEMVYPAITDIKKNMYGLNENIANNRKIMLETEKVFIANSKSLVICTEKINKLQILEHSLTKDIKEIDRHLELKTESLHKSKLTTINLAILDEALNLINLNKNNEEIGRGIIKELENLTSKFIWQHNETIIKTLGSNPTKINNFNEILHGKLLCISVNGTILIISNYSSTLDFFKNVESRYQIEVSNDIRLNLVKQEILNGELILVQDDLALETKNQHFCNNMNESMKVESKEISAKQEILLQKLEVAEEEYRKMEDKEIINPGAFDMQEESQGRENLLIKLKDLEDKHDENNNKMTTYEKHILNIGYILEKLYSLQNNRYVLKNLIDANSILVYNNDITQ